MGEAIMDDLVAFCVERGCIGIDGLALPGHRATKNFFEEHHFTARMLTMHHRLDPPNRDRTVRRRRRGRRSDDALLLIRRGSGPAAGEWSVPGGQVEMGETAHAAVVREVLEETALEVVVDRFLGWVERMADARRRTTS